MADKRLFFSFVAVLVATLACRAAGPSPNSQTPTIVPHQASTEMPDPVSTDAQDLLNPAALPTQTSAIVQSECEAHKWRVIPTEILSDPSKEEGWKYVLIRLAVENNSAFWGKAGIDLKRAFVTTEGGFQYPAVDWHNSWVSNSDPFEGRVDSQTVDFGLIPPGFVAAGTPKAAGLNSGYTQGLFRVAASQNRFQLTLPPGYITCVRDGTMIYEDVGSITVDVDKELTTPSFPANNFENLQALQEPIALPELGTLSFVDYLREAHPELGYYENMLKLQFQFTNASSGYDVQPNIRGYFIGEDGLARPFAFDVCRQDTVGPGLTKELDICTFLPDEMKNVALVITEPVQTAFKLEPSYPQESMLDGHWEGDSNQRGYPPYKVLLTLENCQPNIICGTVDYPDFPCGGVITYLGMEDGKHRLQENITYAERSCIKQVIIELEQAEGDQWNAVWYTGINNLIADGILTKLE